MLTIPTEVTEQLSLLDGQHCDGAFLAEAMTDEQKARALAYSRTKRDEFVQLLLEDMDESVGEYIMSYMRDGELFASADMLLDSFDEYDEGEEHDD